MAGFSVDLDLDMEEPIEVDENSNLPLQDVLPLYNEGGLEMPVDENASETEFHRPFCENVISHPIAITGSTKVKATKIESLLKPVCAVLNSGGGLVRMKITDFSTVSFPLKRLDDFWSGLEDKLIKMISPSTYGDVFDRVVKGDEVFLFMRAPNHWCTIDYNLFVPFDAKTVPATHEKVMDLLSKNTSGKKKNSKNVGPQVPLEKLPVHLLPEQFHNGELLKFHETKQLQFKHFPSHNGILHNNNRTQQESVQKYISAFGNGIGGMILLGVTDEGTVVGQNMEEDSKGETEERLESIVNDMSRSWIFTPERKIHWDIKFFPVIGKDSSFVVVIYIAGMQNLGGIFVKCPTSFELSTSPEHGEEEGICHLDIQDWKKRMLCGTGNRSKGKKEVQERFQMLKMLKGPLLTLRGSVQEIRNAFFSAKRGCPVTPEGFETNVPDRAKEVIKRIQQRCSNGRNRALLVASRSWRCCLGHGSKDDGVICDLLLLTREMKGLHLFTLSDSESEETFMPYAQTTARALKTALVTDGGCHEKFYITPHVVPCRAVTVQVDAEFFADSRYPVEYQLESPREKLNEILKSLVIVLAQKPSMLSNKQGISFFNMLTKEQFQLLYQENDRHKELWINGAAGTGKTLVAVEFIRKLRRLNRFLTNANILYVCENLGIRRKISKLDICECYCRQTFMNNTFPEVKHVILDEVQSFRQEDGDWLEKARNLVRQHCSDSGEDSGHFTFPDDSDSDSVASLASDPKPDATFGAYSDQHTSADPNSDSSSDSDSVDDLGPASHSSRCYGNDPGFLWLFIDRNQVNHRFRTGIPAPIAQNPSFTLTKVIRNSKNICNYAKTFLREDVAAQIEMGHDFEGEQRHFKRYPRGQQISALKKELQMLFEEGYSEGDIAILYGKADVIPDIYPSQLGLSSCFDDAKENDSKHVVLSTFRMYSGLERPVVILIDIMASSSASPYSLRGASLYCAVTRAMIKVIVLEEEKESKRGLKRKHRD